MEKYLSAKLQHPLASQVGKYIKSLNLSNVEARQKMRAFCYHYAQNPSAVARSGVVPLLETSQSWWISSEEQAQRQQWLQEVYPTFQQSTSHSQKQSILICDGCHQNKVEYHEMQIRGADEPMTVFAHCLNCGIKWTQ
jgi:DNA-directed RNA polymerase subunit M/transcription elongation factor TFIIS